ncbi:MAG TPA: DSD1 family PLP-dependent enzyme [Candidatus Latescibacteria bacterium]|jgi:D-serine deaminase-like pyridoxal phosphate-dependent protein|nr:alanine racemase [Gemmatimonadaceae bacterium]MDP6018615.1 DSD1 family PLP-dependent enzyme [Candidatus Latescibacterota bacterium]HJP32837.1 DSD1 family PLP-dependent enzyme [Candidatus Latescibacterota bacterium]
MPSEHIGMPVDEIDTPVLLVDLDDLEYNINMLATHFAQAGKHLRPHTKSHKTPAIAHLQLQAGAIGVTCAKLGEAEVMANAGIDDILIANQVVGRFKIPRLMELARRCNIMAAVDHPDNLADLDSAAGSAGVRPRLLVEVNIGHNRCGVLAESEEAVDLCRAVENATNLHFAGIMGYQGHVVDLPDASERESGARECLERLSTAVTNVRSSGLSVDIVSTSATGDYYISTACDAVTEVQAGSYALMDAAYGQLDLGFRNALTVLTTVTSRPTPDQAITDAGLKTLTPEHGFPLVRLPSREGIEVGWDPEGLRFLECHALSEEHGRLRTVGGDCHLQPGDLIEFIPGHGCTTMNLHDQIYAVRDDRLEAVWPIAARGKVR